MGDTDTPHDVGVHQPFNFTKDSYGLIEDLLGEPAIPGLEEISAPWITIDGRIHTATCRWLEIRALKSPSTVRAVRNVRRYIDFLVNNRGRWHSDEALSDVMTVTNDDLVAFRRHLLQNLTSPVSATTWNQINTSIKLFHEFAKAEFDLPLPWIPRLVPGRSGFLVTTNDLSVRSKRSGTGTPLHPDFVDILIESAMRLSANYEDHGGEAVHRDVSFIHLGLATGMRRSNLRVATHYELPPARSNNNPFNLVRIPDAVTKGMAGSVAISFEHRLQLVRDFITQVRPELVEASRRNHRPAQPIQITNAGIERWEGIGHLGRPISRKWADTDTQMRERLVDIDGSSPVIHLTMKGTVMGESSASSIVTNASRWAQENLEPSFPNVRLHDLRHTFAVHLAVCIYLGALAEHLPKPISDAYSSQQVADAVIAVQASLGHADPSTTSIYITHTTEHLLQGTSLDRYIFP